MTDPAIRIACAEACGWKDINPKHGAPIGRPADWDTERDTRWFNLPDYPNDLNACAQFEATLKYEEQPVYLLHLKRVLMRTSPTQSAAEFEQTTATARQRCEAFLKVKGLWKPKQL